MGGSGATAATLTETELLVIRLLTGTPGDSASANPSATWEVLPVPLREALALVDIRMLDHIVALFHPGQPMNNVIDSHEARRHLSRILKDVAEGCGGRHRRCGC